MGIDIVSIGVQSFNQASCLKQCRIWCDEKKVSEIVQKFHQKNVWVNIDLVALFGGDEEADWIVFEDDLKKACEVVDADVITSIPNYRTKLNYLNQIPRFRAILQQECEKSLYRPFFERMLSQNSEDIKNYGKNDHWIAKREYWDFYKKSRRYSCSGPRSAKMGEQITLGIGGAEKHKVYSYLPDGNVMYSFFDFEKDVFCNEFFANKNYS